MSDSDANPARRRTRTSPAMPQVSQSAPTPAASRRRALRVDPFSVEPLSRPRRRTLVAAEAVKPARTRKRGRDEVDPNEADHLDAPTRRRKGKRAETQENKGKSTRNTRSERTDADAASETTPKGKGRGRGQHDDHTLERTNQGRGSKSSTDHDEGKESGSSKRSRGRNKDRKPLALPPAKTTPALPEPKPVLALEDPKPARRSRKKASDVSQDGDGQPTDATQVDTPLIDQDEDVKSTRRTRRRTRSRSDESGVVPKRARVPREEAVTDERDDDLDADEYNDAGEGKRKRRPRRRKRKAGGGDGSQHSTRSGSKQGGRRSHSAQVPTEVRHAIDVAPPRKMLVTRKDKTTQIAVLEDRTLVEHYVTQSNEQSFVGNIYKGRVQNVLPGMEAAFVDIGKGRNGVLYAGEVLYDEADLDGQPARIETQLKPGQTVIVQVTKDPMGTKGARLTQQLSLAGRFCVLSPYDSMLGISRKLPEAERERLRKILKGVRPEGYGLIVRTAAEGCTPDQLIADVERLVKRWKRVEEKIEKAKALEMVYAEPDLVLRVIRDVFGGEHTELIVDDEELLERIRDYLGETSPEDVSKIQRFSPEGADGETRNLFGDWQITAQVRRALETKVWLKSGGYLIIEKTEAMWVIDVNTGRFVGKDNLEETILKNNIEAAIEIARQLRLRDMGGIIVIDFVDMIVPAHRDEVLRRFKAELARDKTKTRVMDISKLGLVQMTRKNVSKGLMEVFTEPTDDVIPGRRLIKKLLDD